MSNIIVMAVIGFLAWFHGYYKGVQATKRKTREFLGGRE